VFSCAGSLAPILLSALVGTSLTACGPADEAAAGTSDVARADGSPNPAPTAEGDHAGHDHGEPDIVAVDDAVTAEIEDLIEKLKPLDPTLTSDHHDRWFIRNQKLVAELKLREPDVGRAALQAYFEANIDDSLTRARLLEIAAYTAPEDARETLHHLMVDYGHRIDDRTEATLLYAQSSPEQYLETAEKYLLRRTRPFETMPNDEFLVRGWVTACEQTGRSPVPMLADVVTNLVMEDAARHYAAQELGRFPDPFGRKALEVALLEVTGNHYVRRKAAQSLRDSLPRETACQTFREALAAELDVNMRKFLEDMIQTNCR